MRVAINALSVQTGGGLTFLRNLLKHLPAVDPTHEYVVLTTRQKQAEFELPANGARVSSVVVPARNWVARSCWEQTVLPRMLRRMGVDVLYAPGNQGPVLSSVPVVLFVQNVYPLQHERYGLTASLRAKMAVQRLVMRACVSQAAKVIAVSEYTRRLLVTELRCRESAITVIPHGRPEDAAGHADDAATDEVNGQRIRRPYFLGVSDVRVNKNYETLLEGFALVARDLDPAMAVVIAGAVEDQEYYQRLCAHANRLGILSRVQFLGSVDAGALRRVYAGALALVFPSRVESFGLPPLEAMTYGVPVIAADIAAVREICATAPLFFHPCSAADLGDAMRRLAGDAALRSESIRRGLERARHFNWESTARSTLRLLQEAAA